MRPRDLAGILLLSSILALQGGAAPLPESPETSEPEARALAPETPEVPDVIFHPKTGEPYFLSERVLQEIDATGTSTAIGIEVSEARLKEVQREIAALRILDLEMTEDSSGTLCDFFNADALRHAGTELREPGGEATLASLAANSELVVVGRITDVSGGLWGVRSGSCLAVAVTNVLKNSKRAPFLEESILVYEDSYSFTLGGNRICVRAEDRYAPSEGDEVLLLLPDWKDLDTVYSPHLLFKLEEGRVTPPASKVLGNLLAPIDVDALSRIVAETEGVSGL